MSKDCKPVEAIFARGSGQNLLANEYDNYMRNLDKYIAATDITYNIYELGTHHQRGSDGIGYKYPAVSVNTFAQGYINAGRAFFSNGDGHRYGKSVEDGVKELALYLNQRFTRPGACQNSRIIIAGYSQGAQLVGQFAAINSGWVDKSVRDRIDYIALLGDPKLFLPEGLRGHAFVGRPACRNSNHPQYYLSVWRATVPECDAHKGSLAARIPYVTDEFLYRTGTWCNSKDPICSERHSMLMPGNNGHGKYVSEGRIDEAVKESLTWAARKMQNNQHRQQLLNSIRNNGAPSGSATLPFVPPSRLDVNYDYRTGWYTLPCTGYIAIDKYQPFVIQTTLPYLGTKTRDVRYKANAMAGYFLSEGCDVAVYSYDSFVSTTDFRLLQPATTNIQLVEKAVYDAPFVLQQENQYERRCGVGQHVRAEVAFMRDIVIGDSPHPTQSKPYVLTGASTVCPNDMVVVHELLQLYEDYDMHQNIHGWTLRPTVLDVYATFPFTMSDGNRMMQSSDSNTSQMGMMRMSQPERVLPTGDFAVAFDFDTYYAEVGEEIELSVRSVNPAVDLHEYKMFYWDLDGDGVFDSVTEKPNVTHIYSQPFTGQVNVTAENLDDERFGATAEMIARADIDEIWRVDDVIVPAAPRNLSLSAHDATTIDLEWVPADEFAAMWQIQVNDSPGVWIDSAEVSSAAITDIDITQSATIYVRGATKDGTLGEYATATWQPADDILPDDEQPAPDITQPESSTDSSEEAVAVRYNFMGETPSQLRSSLPITAMAEQRTELDTPLSQTTLDRTEANRQSEVQEQLSVVNDGVEEGSYVSRWLLAAVVITFAGVLAYVLRRRFTQSR